MNGNFYRLKMLNAAAKCGRGHLGGAFSCIEILMAINDTLKPEDKFILSKGHSAIALYSILYNEFPFCEDGSLFAEHPSSQLPKIQLTTGSLGHGIGIGCGMALAKKLNNENGIIYVLVGDGECMEGSIYEALMFAVIHKLNNLIVIIDNNKTMSTDNLSRNIDYWEIFGGIGCDTRMCYDGHDIEVLKRDMYINDLPVVIVAYTTKGKGVSFMENSVQWHNGVPMGEQLELARTELSQ